MSIPPQVGRYRIARPVGAGAFATVWLAYDDELHSPVAVKVLADNWCQRADIRGRFRQEARFMRQVDSDHLVRVLDIGELPDGRPYLVMTYAAGGTLADRLAGGPMPVRAALRIAADIARAVAVLHDSGVLHRDLKPSNVLFDPTPAGDRVLVADLGWPRRSRTRPGSQWSPARPPTWRPSSSPRRRDRRARRRVRDRRADAPHVDRLAARAAGGGAPTPPPPSSAPSAGRCIAIRTAAGPPRPLTPPRWRVCSPAGGWRPARRRGASAGSSPPSAQ